MRAMRVTLAFAVLLAGAGSGARVPAALAGNQQCYHKVFEPIDACSTCTDTCKGGIYMCCTIVPG